MSVEGPGDLINEGHHFTFITFGMHVDATIGQILDITSHVIAPGDTEHLRTETDPLDVSSIPSIAMGDMG